MDSKPSKIIKKDTKGVRKDTSKRRFKAAVPLSQLSGRRVDSCFRYSIRAAWSRGSLGAVKKQTNAYNVVYVGVEGALAIEEVNAPQMASVVALERVAEKPFLVEDGQWSVVVPPSALMKAYLC